jgi:hypothetical protein
MGPRRMFGQVIDLAERYSLLEKWDGQSRVYLCYRRSKSYKR